jgi:isoleucyl-tRNA synthetase
MSKSLGNYVNAIDMVKNRGAELLRLWVSAEDYQNDIRISEEIMQRISEAYRRIRNTSRFLLGNIDDFNPVQHRVSYDKMLEVDRFILHRFATMNEQVIKAYEAYSFHSVYQALYNFCNVDLSSFYLDVSKDSLYTNAPNSLERRSAQTAVYEMVTRLAPLLAPILSFTAEEIWQYLPERRPQNQAWGSKTVSSVFLSTIQNTPAAWQDDGLAKNWEQLMLVRADVLKALEKKRAEKTIGSSLEACVSLAYTTGNLARQALIQSLLEKYRDDLAMVFIVSAVEFVPATSKLVTTDFQSGENIPELLIKVTLAEGKKCESCWVIKTDIGGDSQHPTICGRCSQALKGMV